MLNNLPALVTTIGIAHAGEPAASLVVWPVIYQLAVVFASPVADWDTVTAAALRGARAGRAVWTATGWLTVVFGGLFALVVVTGADTFYVRDFAAVPDVPATLGLTWLWLLVPVPVLWVLRASLRGAVMAAERRVGLVAASAVHLLLLASTVAALCVTTMSGVAVGALSIVAGLVGEILVLAHAARAFSAGPVGTRTPLMT